MTNGFQELIEGWDGAGVVVHFDAATEAWFFVALHDATLGPPTGGCRMKVYPRPAEGLLDAMRLSRGMTYKWAVAGLGFGGGKSVIALRAPLKREERAALLRRFGRFLEGLHGAYWTGEDMGTTPDDMATIAEESRFVHGVVGRDSRTGTREAVDPGPYTAQGVLAGIQGALEHTEGSSDLSGTSVLIQGVGDVGAPLARLMKERGAQIRVSDLDLERANRVAGDVGGEVVDPDRALDRSSDVFAPCAIGAVLNSRTIPLLRCRIVAGSANNQLEEDQDAELLHQRGIVYVPDYVLNAGGAIALGLMSRGAGDEEIRRGIEGIGATVRAILEEARETGGSPVHAADRLARRRLREEGTDGVRSQRSEVQGADG